MKSICLVGVMLMMSACGTSGLKNHLVHSGVSIRNELSEYDFQVRQILSKNDSSRKISYLGPSSQGN